MIVTMLKIYLYIILDVFCIFWYTVEAVCPDNCNTCVDFDRCTSCKSDKWNLNISCGNICNNNCLNQECQDDNGYCNQCKTGLYGLQCQRNCSLCENALCGLRICTSGCKSGYYDFNDGRETFCQVCPPNCKTCSNSYACEVCNDGYYFYKYITDGRLRVDCNPCPDSSQPCQDFCAIQDCIKCQISADKIVCTECNEGFEWNEDICLPITSKCAQGCSTDCDNYGICLGICNSGWTGERCSEQCASQCLACTKNNATVCEQCTAHFYTTRCNIKCPESCNKVTSKQTCRIDDGYCLNDCDRTFWGSFCNESCPYGCSDDGMSKLCDRRNGSCILQCKDWFTGANCDTSLSTTPTVKPEDATSLRTTVTHSDVHDVSPIQTLTSTHFRSKENTDNNINNGFVTGYFSGFGSAAMVGTSIVALFFIRRRYIEKKSRALKDSSNSKETHTYYNEQIEQRANMEGGQNGTPNYEDLNETRQAEMTYSELQRRV